MTFGKRVSVKLIPEPLSDPMVLGWNLLPAQQGFRIDATAGDPRC